jgi:hypothetical protein
MQNEDSFLEPDGVNGPIGSIRIVFKHLEYTSAAETFQNFCSVVPFAILGEV